MKRILVVILFCYLFLPANVKMIPLYINNHEIIVEVADTPAKKATGLMFRKNIPDDFGMLFIFDDEQIRSFWMKNCRVHLDIIYLDGAKQVVDIHKNVPPCQQEPCKSYVSKKRARYVLELRGGRTDELKLKIGGVVFFIMDQ